jgi:cellulase
MVSGHTIMQAVGGYSQGVGIYMPSDDSPQTNVGSNSMACNGSPVGGFRAPKQKITMNAGSTYTGAWLHTLTSTGADSTADNKVIDSSHKGPVFVYMKKVSDSLSGNPSAGPGGGWFKIAQDSYSNGQWAVDRLINAGGIQSFTIPKCIANGDYLVRLELLALHSAYNSAGAQFYMECISVTVTGGTGAKSPATVSIPGTYSANDPGIKVQIWVNGKPYPSSYTTPGPAVFTC